MKDSNNTKKKGVARRVAGGLFKPYTYAFKSLSSSGQNIKGDAQTLLGLIEKKKDKSNIVYMDAPDSKAAFEMLFKENEWTEEDLSKQKILIRRAKFIMMGCAWLSFMGFFYFLMQSIMGFIHEGPFLMTSYFSMLLAFCAVLFLSSSLKNAVFQEQIEQRDLITLKRFIAEGELVRKFLS